MRTALRKLASFDDDIDFRRLWKIGFVVSAIALLLSLGSFAVQGLDLGIDFEGGTAWEVEAPGASVSDVRDVLGGTGAEGAKIQIIGDDTVRVQDEPGTEDQIAEVRAALAELGSGDIRDVGVSTVGPTWGDEISEKAIRALVWFFVILAGYLAWRLEWKMAVGALAASMHDLIITVGFYSVFGLEVTPATVIAVLTILGYSLYDGIVVFDKVQENEGKPSIGQKLPYTDIMSLSLNQVLMRSLNTAITSLLPVVAMLFVGSFLLGAVTLQEFAVALAVGIITGAYSSIFISAPLTAWLKEREPHWQAVRQRLEHQGARRAATGTVSDQAAPAAVTTGPASPGTAPTPSGRAIPPRPRKKGKRR